MPALRGSMRRLGGLVASAAVIGVGVIAGASPALAAVSAGAGGALPNAIVNTAYTPVTVTGSGGTGPYAIVVTGAAPAGMTFPSGTDSVMLSGTPTAAGMFSFSVKVTDSTSATDTKTYTLVVATNPDPPTIGTATAGPADHQATVAFTPPASTGFLPITGYTATSNPGGITGSCTASPCTVSGLTDGTSYTFTVTATNSAPLTSVASGASNAVVPKIPQAITFANPGPKPLGSPVTLTATGGASGNPVTFTSTTPTICTVSGTTLTPVALGTCTINADQAGNATYLAAPTVPQTFSVTKATSTLTVTANPTTSVYGQAVTFTATFPSPVPTGTLQWSVNGTDVGTPVTLTSSLTYTFTSSTPLAVGSDIVKATYSGDATHDTANAQATETVSKASTTTAVTVSGNTPTATVAPVAPGAGTPTGTVSFSVGGVTAGTGPVGAGGVATFNGTNVGNQAVAATYSGDGNFLTSTGNRAPIAPTVRASITSAFPKHGGWYRAPVTVTFTCTPNTAPLTAPCPSPVRLTRNRAGQSATVTVTATDGGTTTKSVRGISIDTVAPNLTVMRHGTELTCHGLDGLSGIVSCVIHRHQHVRNGIRTVRWTAVARDRAGNTATKHGRFSYFL